MRRIALTLSLLCTGTLMASLSGIATAAAPPQTAFEQNGGTEWTTHQEELSFLNAVDNQSARMSMSVIGRTKQGRPLHLVRLGDPVPPTRDTVLRRPSILFVCTQHGNEPAGREACLQMIRTLAFTKNPVYRRQLQNHGILVIPTANPDGRAANTRGNSDGTDINRDHLNLLTPEARAIGRVVRDWRPDASVDLHEYGQTPIVYDDEMQILWPRNLNTDSRVHWLAKTLAIEYIGRGVLAKGYTWDEYGQYAVRDQDIAQTAGDADEGIMRNAMGLRHSLGILVETDTTPNVQNNGPGEADPAEVMRRRVASHRQAMIESLRFLRDQGSVAKRVTARAFERTTDRGREQSRPVFFGGADNQEPAPEDVQDPPPCAYRLTETERSTVARTMKLLGIESDTKAKGALISMVQSAGTLIPLLVDERGARHSVEATARYSC